MEFPVYRNDTTIVDILNFDTWQGVLFMNQNFNLLIEGENFAFILLSFNDYQLLSQLYDML